MTKNQYLRNEAKRQNVYNKKHNINSKPKTRISLFKTLNKMIDMIDEIMYKLGIKNSIIVDRNPKRGPLADSKRAAEFKRQEAQIRNRNQ